MHMSKLVMAVIGLGLISAVVAADNAAPEQSKPAEQTPTTAGAPDQQAAPEASKLKIVEVEAGQPGARDGDIVLVYYTGRLEDGKVFDSTDNHGGKPFQFTLGQGRVIKGWDQGIVGMKIGQKRQLVIPPELAYGAAGQGPIPANATLTFDVQLVGLVRLAKEDSNAAK